MARDSRERGSETVEDQPKPEAEVAEAPAKVETSTPKPKTIEWVKGEDGRLTQKK